MQRTELQKIAGSIGKTLEVPDWWIYSLSSKTFTTLEPVLTPFEQWLKETFPYASEAVYDYVDRNKFHTTPKELPLQNPSHALFAIPVFFVGLAFFFVLGKILGKRKYQLLSLVHNSILFWLSLYMFVCILAGILECNYSLLNNTPKDRKGGEWRVAKAVWIFYVSKLYEFGDTFIMMLTQSYRQVTFLHLYHHVSVFLMMYNICLVCPNGDAVVSPVLNSLVHVFMYGYYAGTTLFPSGSVRRILNGAKFMITKGQLLQFVCSSLHSFLLYTGIVPPRIPYSVYFSNFYYELTLIALFAHFLIVNQRKAAAEKKAAKKKKE